MTPERIAEHRKKWAFFLRAENTCGCPRCAFDRTAAKGVYECLDEIERLGERDSQSSVIIAGLTAKAADARSERDRLLTTIREFIAASDQSAEGGDDVANMLQYGYAFKALQESLEAAP